MFRACPRCGLELGHRQLKVALVDRLVYVVGLSEGAAVRSCFPDDTPSADLVAPRKGGLARARQGRRRAKNKAPEAPSP